MENQTKLVAFYLPQFHAIPENDRAWGKGFTEWTNVKKALPIYKGQYQPQIPLNNNYYNLLDVKVMEEQAKMAKEYGVYGFCYYHYYFKDGKKLLEKPLEQMLKDPKVDIPFCLCWANEPWSKRWDGSENEIIVEQEYGKKEEWYNHFMYLLPFFQDSRYIKDKMGAPLFVIYKPYEIPEFEEMLKYWKKLCVENGLPAIKFIVQYPERPVLNNEVSNIFDGMIQFEPIYTLSNILNDSHKKVSFVLKHPIFGGKIICNKIYNFLYKTNRHAFSYDMIVQESLKIEKNDKLYPGVFTGWDNTPRRGKNATYYKGSTPEKFEKYLAAKLEKNEKESNKEFLFINAWNEWGEGAYLEPDEKYQYGYLNAVKNVLKGMEK